MSNGKDLLQGLAEAVLGHYSREAVVAVLDYVAGMSSDDMREMTSGMSVEEKARAYRVWTAAKPTAEPSSIVVGK